MTRISKKMLVKQAYFVLIMTVILSVFCIFTGTNVYAAPDINSVTGGNTSTSQSSNSSASNETKSAADGLSQAFHDSAISNEDLAKASSFASPYVKGVNFVLSIVLACFSVILGVVTVLDLLYIAVPPIRKFLCAETAAQPQGGGMGMGMGRMGMGGMGMGGMGAANQPSQTGIGRFVSDEAVAALAEANATAQPQGGGMGMGMGMMGGMGAAQQAQPKTKSVILTYAKKRAFALIVFAACIVLLTSTLFTDIGLYIGSWIIETVGGLF